MAMASNEKILIGIDGEVIELKGADKQEFLAQKAKDDAEFVIQQAKEKAKAEEKSALLARLGLTEAEVKLLLS